MNMFEYSSELDKIEVNYIINLISDEIKYLKKIKHNLTRFAYVESKNGRLRLLDFQRIASELERLAIEIEFLERKKTYYINVKHRK